MSLFITALNSGSNGNCYYIGNGTEAVLIDAGISCRETERRLQRLQLSMEQVKAIFVSHEHTDHISGVPALAAQYRLPVYSTAGTFRKCPFQLPGEQVMHFRAFEPVCIDSLSITAFPKRHDAVEPHSFVISCHGINVGVFTDIGAPCKHLVHYFQQCHAAFLEANYDEVLLEQGRYPHYLKNRIRGGKGHLSNKQALQFFSAYKPAHMSHLILSHLSQENNAPEIVQQLFTPYAAGVGISVASRYKETPVYTINGRKKISKPKPVMATHKQAVQMSLF